ncbi:MAG: hypothetical protein KDD14_01630 [Saprospiraceae bacterium]|nr:hypothetical protein [Saprospiraceae bacterium]
MHQPTSVFPVLLLTLSLACQQCSSGTDSGQTSGYQEPPATHFTTLNVDSILVFPFEQGLGFYGSGFLFSPIEKNKIWLLPEHQDGGFELDLKTGKRTPFYEKFGHAFLKKPLRAEWVHFDPYDKNCTWFLNFYEGVFCFDHATRQGRFFDIAQNKRVMQTILFTAKHVWISTSTGLWMYDRLTGICGPVQGSPDIGAARLAATPDGKVLVGYQYLYDPASYCWEELTTYRGLPITQIKDIEEAGGFTLAAKKDDTRLYIIHPDGTTSKMVANIYSKRPGGGGVSSPARNFLNYRFLFPEPPFFWSINNSNVQRLDARTGEIQDFDFGGMVIQGGFPTVNAPAEIWNFNSDYWLSLQKTSGENQIYRAALNNRILSANADSEYLYLLGTDAFAIVNKQYLAKRYAADQTLPAKRALLNHLIDSLQVYPVDDWPVHREKTNFLIKQFAGISDPYIRSRIAQFAISFNCPRDEKSLRQFLEEDGLDTLIVDRAYICVVENMVRRGALRDALRLNLELKARYANSPPFQGGNSERDLSQLLQTIVGQLDSIDQTGNSAYEILWGRGLLIEEFCRRCEYFSNSVCYDYRLADSIYLKLEREYPQSPRADDAAFQRIMNSRCHEGEDGSDHPEEVEAWEKFIRKYPISELRADALGNMTWALGRTEADLRKGLRWLAEAEQLNPALFEIDSNGNEIGYYAYTKREFQQQLNWIDLDFTFQFKKKNNRRNEPVEVVFIVRNKSNETKYLRRIIDPALPNFSIEVTPDNALVNCVRPLEYVESKVYNFPRNSAGWGILELPPGKTYSETWDLTKTVSREHSAFLGRYVFNQPGTYRVQAASVLVQGIFSECIPLEIQ